MGNRHRGLTLALVSALGACTSTPSDTGTPVSVEPSTAPEASASASEAAEHFPIEAFANISENPVSKDEAAELQALLDDMAGRAGIAATVMSPDGTWSGATGKADGVRDVRVDDQFFIASITKSIIAAQVMEMVEAGELQLDDPATDHLPRISTSTPTGRPSASCSASEAVSPKMTSSLKTSVCWRIRDGCGRRPRYSSSSPRTALPPVRLSSTRTPTTSCSGW